MRLKRVGLVVLCLTIGYCAHWFVTRDRGRQAVHSIIAMSWGDGRYGKAFYGAEIYIKPTGTEYAVRGRVWIGRGNATWHDLGKLGTVATPAEAVEKWGRIEWTPEALVVGPGDPEPFSLPRTELESHR